MPSKEYYLAKAEQYEMAAAAASTDEATTLRVVACAYLELANAVERAAVSAPRYKDRPIDHDFKQEGPGQEKTAGPRSFQQAKHVRASRMCSSRARFCGHSQVRF
jgi:hypothetical protein